MITQPYDWPFRVGWLNEMNKLKIFYVKDEWEKYSKKIKRINCFEEKKTKKNRKKKRYRRWLK